MGRVGCLFVPGHCRIPGHCRSGDPQWYFQMYGSEDPQQSWHAQWGWEGRFQDRMVLSILLGG